MISGVIHIYGIPTYSDCGQILIQIYDTEGYILKDYILNIKLDENNEGSIIDVGEQK